MCNHGGRHRYALLAQEPSGHAQTVSRHTRHREIVHSPDLRALRADDSRREFSGGDQPPLQGTGAAASARARRAAGALRAHRPQHGPLHRLCGLYAAQARPRGRDDCHPVGPSDSQRGGVPTHRHGLRLVRLGARRAADHRHHPHPPRNGLRIHPGLGRAGHQQGEELHREARSGAGADLPPVRRVSLELGHLRLEGEHHHRGLPPLSARAARPVQRRHAGTGERRRAHGPGDCLFGVPRRLNRLRRDGEGRQRICPPRRLRLERRGDLGLGLPALAQGPLRQRRAG